MKKYIDLKRHSSVTNPIDSKDHKDVKMLDELKKHNSPVKFDEVKKQNDAARHGTLKNRDEMQEILSGLQADKHVQEMKNYIQHGDVSTYEHCENVAKLCYKVNKALPLHADLKTLLVGAMLHDFYLYDWHEEGDGSHHWHGFRHAGRASRNARKYFNIDKDTEHVINSHMWPLNPARIPHSKEAWMVCLADKYVSLHETLFKR